MSDQAGGSESSTQVGLPFGGGSLAGGTAFAQKLGKTLRNGDVALALGVVTILVVLILPMPSWLLDISLAISMTLSVLVLMTVLFIQRALDFSSFPTVLLIATMLRLSLNLASTRLILSKGHEGTSAAGHVIEAFGNFVMAGNFVIGIIVFAILVIVNFIVITKGSGRIAEVSARFSLDAMPGKQMAIDADLSSGLINEDQARLRRRELEEESNFYGAMDGAAKFVRGDAVAGLLITGINVVGGMIIGVAQQGMAFADAAHSYTVLTVGDGLVSQIPALVVSTGAGLLVSKAATTGSTDKALFGQLGAYPKALGLSSFLMLALALLPGIPFLPFVLLSVISGTAAWYLDKRRTADAASAVDAEAEAAAAAPVAEEPISAHLQIDYIRLELGYGLLALLGEQTGPRLTDQIKSLRRQLAQEMGFVLPSVRIQDNLQLAPNAYVIRIKEIAAGEGELRPNMLLVMDPRGEPMTLPGEETTEPTFGLPALWVDPGAKEEALFRGYTVVDPQTVITTHLTEAVKENTAELLSYAETQKLLDDLDSEQQKLIGDMIPNQIAVGGVQRVLQNLLAERISIRDLPTILEGISEACGYTRNLTAITEHVRARLARQISNAVGDHEGVIPLITLSPTWEQTFADSLVGEGEDRQVSMAPSKLQEFITQIRQVFERQAMMGVAPALLTSPRIRPYVRSIVERFRPTTPVLSQNEIHPKARIRTVGQI
ncbi:flagellar biosynthesis protein FlhA [Tistlia consotensis]|uniref:Flagellar biosynthesis protein FlhA n=1 Tax=Tistlia consotensis USBA 355 TaxID=560819 RepID=A0A1Y6CP08_9PROT|nr:flagellar biosynthesis protein FlhA [Tistlia consotensis]SMF67622.1 flagellar biosynthesis protein FlhA [Tistlia consotensis USBA 355]SNR99782.1 flagellar biosynthesis protein FlhA [Tistlia consotensis]